MSVATSNDADWRVAFAVTVPDDDEVQQPIDLRGIEFMMRVWKVSGGHEILLSSEDGELSVSGVNYNIFSILVLVDRMRYMPRGTWPWEIIATADGATVEFVLGTIVHAADGGSLVTSFAATPRTLSEL